MPNPWLHPELGTLTVIWDHPELGRFRYGFTGWEAQFHLPAFKQYRYRWLGKNVGRSNIKLEFEAEELDELPSKTAIRVAKRVIANQQTIAERIKQSVFRNLLGKGRPSGVWWDGELGAHGDDFLKFYDCDIKQPLREPDDLCRVLGGVSIRIRERVYGYEKPSATVEFEAAYEIEHGVGVLTNGTTILGIGYQGDVGPFLKPAERGGE